MVLAQSDHPVLNSRYLVYEAQQAHYYGLPHNLALAAVTTTPATVMGQDHRIGYVKEGELFVFLTYILRSEDNGLPLPDAQFRL